MGMEETTYDPLSVNSDNICGLNRVKFLYSYGGRILPRPKDGKLRYVGGQTRVVAANRNIAFSDLVAKMEDFLGSGVALKCQLPTEDLDALVSIKSDEDLENILEEYDRLGSKEDSFKVRAFLFPISRPPLASGHMATIREGYVASSTPSEVYRPPRISQEPNRLGMYACPGLSRNPHCSLHVIRRPRGLNPVQAKRPSRYPHVSPVGFPLRSATPIHDTVTVPHQHKYSATALPTAYVETSSSCARIVYSPSEPRVPFPGRATMAPQGQGKTKYNYRLRNHYYGGGLQSFGAHQQLLVQH